MNSTWHTSYQLQKVMWCESFASFESRAASESIQRRKTVFPQKTASVSRNSFLNCRSNALLMWNTSNYSYFTSSSVFMLYPLGQPKEFFSFVTSLLSGSMALQSSGKMLVVDQYITFKDRVLIPVWQYLLSAWFMLSSLQFQRDRQWNVLGRYPELTFNC